MANISELGVLLKANTKQAEGQLKSFSDKTGSSFSKLKVGVAAVGAAVAAFTFKAVNNFIATGDALDKMSRRTSISVEALDQLQHVFTLSGTTIQGFEKGIMTLQKQMLAATQGSKIAADAFAELEIPLEGIDQLSPEELFNKVAEGLVAMESDTRRAATAMALLGRFGTQVIPALDGGIEVFEEMREQAELSAFWTTEQASRAAVLADQQAILNRNVDTLTMTYASMFVPALIKVSTAINDLTEDIQKNGIQSRELWKMSANLLKVMPGLGPAGVLASKGLEKFWIETETATEKAERLADIEDKLHAFLDADRGMTDELTTARDKLKGTTDDLITANFTYTTMLAAEIRQLNAGIAVIRNSTTEFQANEEAVAILPEKYIALMKTIEDYINKVKEATTETKELNEAMDMTEEMKDIDRRAGIAFRQITEKMPGEQPGGPKPTSPAENETSTGTGTSVLGLTTKSKISATLNKSAMEGHEINI